jgi:hypothetical protein
MKLTIETARNGYIIRDDEDGFPYVIADDDPVDATFNLLVEVREMIGHIGSRYDERRVRVVIEPGDKWIGPEERAEILGTIEGTEKRDPDDFCPKCKADLRGDPIPEKDQYLFGTTHFSRKIGYYDTEQDRTTMWLCPDCEHQWTR